MAQIPENKGLVSVIIPTRDRREELLACLRSLESAKGDFEVIVVDDGSGDRTADAVRAGFPEAQVIRSSESFGPGPARDLGIAAARGEYVLFLDSDVELPDEGVIERMAGMLARNAEIGQIGGQMADAGAAVFGRRVTRDGGSRPAVEERDAPDGFTECDFLPTCNCMVRRSAVTEAGGFDPYYGFGAEDKDLGVRIGRRGLRNGFGGRFSVIHKCSGSGRNPDETYRYHLTRIRFVLKNLPLRNLAFCLLKDAVRALLFYPLLPLKALVKWMRGQKLRRENFTAAIIILRAYAWNLRHWAHTRACRRTNFLDPAEMRRFEASGWAEGWRRKR